MDRKLYLEKCQKYAISGNVVVIFDKIKYFPYGYVMQFDEKGNPCHFAMLKDKNQRTIMYANLERVEEDE